MKVLVQLPNNASTSKYPKTFPQPLNLLSFYEDGDELIDLALMSFKKKKEDILSLLLAQARKLNRQGGNIIVNAGDFPPDAAYSIYYDYFFSKLSTNIQVIGSYPKIFPDKVKRFQLVFQLELPQVGLPNILSTLYEFLRYDALDFKAYPLVNNKFKFSLRASYGCPRRCKMCPVPKCFDGEFKFFDINNTVAIIEEAYSRGARYFTFIDDNLSISPKFILLLKEIEKLKLKGVQFHCQEGFDIQAFNKELASLLKALRFDDIKIAFENIKPAFLKQIGKGHITKKKIKEVIKIADSSGLKIKTFFLIGLDETEEDILDNLKFFAEYRLSVRVNIIRNYATNFFVRRKLSDTTLKNLKALSYSVSFFNQKGVNIFKGKDELEKLGYRINGNTIYGNTKFGFQTSRFEKGISYIFGKRVKNNTRDSITLVDKKRGFLNGV